LHWTDNTKSAYTRARQEAQASLRAMKNGSQGQASRLTERLWNYHGMRQGAHGSHPDMIALWSSILGSLPQIGTVSHAVS